MTLPAFLQLLTKVKERANGWHEACCPAHEDKSPSLKVRAGDRGVIVKCWSCCPTAAICAALGIKVKDLFYDGTPDAGAIRKRKAQQLAAYEARLHQGKRIDARREADYFVRSCRWIDIHTWSDDQLDGELAVLAKAYAVLGADGQRLPVIP